MVHLARLVLMQDLESWLIIALKVGVQLVGAVTPQEAATKLFDLLGVNHADIVGVDGVKKCAHHEPKLIGVNEDVRQILNRSLVVNLVRHFCNFMSILAYFDFLII